ncbi:restriction endonuclease subunit S [Clostridium baratii]|uniref:Restriction modification system DNA specificity domain-containing protein n=1 Tax=Clostridium baratii TaxID=1561 RepID=A0A174TWT9_9CLOT|nr:restriction endonuclease subunit S [Clostridium baratii]CUQ12437.1 restriction modification system DNA specificity domain-containing protein [Clostridium baratii]
MIIDVDQLDCWRMKKIPELLFFQEGPGVRNSQYTDKGIKLLNVANLQDGKLVLSNTDRYISEEEAYGRYKHFLVDDGDLIIASSGIKVEYFDKKMGFAEKSHLPLCMNTSTIRFKSLDIEELNIRYFAYFLKTNYFKKQIGRLITGSAQLNFGPSHLKQIYVIVPPLEIQLKIVDVLDKAKELIDKRKEQIEALDELVKSKFIEMFGDPINNPMKWEVKKMKDISSNIMSGNTPKGGEKVYVEKGIMFLRSQNVWKNKLILDDVAYIDEETHSKMKKSSLKYKDILMTKTGRINTENSSLGRAAMFLGEDDSANVNGHVYLIRLQNDIINEFVLYILTSKEYRGYIRSVCVGGIDKRQLNKEHIENFPIIFPPIEEQEKFVSYVKKVDKLKFKMEKSLKELEDNFNSLMQKAFKGELFNED